ncbi:MAG TPA: SpoIIE family protein phosphatase [Chthoniobacterales bacterium]|jgi:sigma-B regulation protein RsbU (phosphoserine phosphatase)|nr:SpoIIE family protein phosphatase [Chthoniobacterales bacterium]
MKDPQEQAVANLERSGPERDERSRWNEEKLYLALSSAGMGSWDWDLLDHSMHWDDRMHSLFGLSPLTFFGRYEQFLEMISAQDRQHTAEQFADAIDNRSEYQGTFRVVWPSDGSVHTLRVRSKVCCNDQGKPTCVTGICWEAGERSDVESALERERFLLKTLMDNLPDNIYFKDRESRFTTVNRAMAAWFGLMDPADLAGKTDADLFAPEHALAALRDEQAILRTGQPLVNREEKETWADGRETWVSTTKLPLRAPNGQIIGTFGLSRDITEKKRAEEKLAALARELRAKNEALEEDLEMARELQQAMLPHRYPRFPHHASKEESAVHFYHFYQPSMSVSGDFFEVLKLSDTTAGLFICDVMGHGVRAALVASTVSALVGQLRDYCGNPGEFLTRLNRGLRATLEYSDGPLFASAFYLLADLDKGTLRYANAGHPNPLRIHWASERADTYPLNGARPGPAIGLFEDAVYSNCSCELSPQDTVLLFTDGLFEVEGPGGEIYDYRRLLEAVNRRCGLPAFQLCHEIIEEVQRFSAGRHFSDDVCLVAMECHRLQLTADSPA